MTDERIYSPRISGANKLKSSERSSVEMIEINNNSQSLAVDNISKNGTSTERVPSEIYSPEDAINRAGFGKFQVKLIILSGFVSLAVGFDSVLSMFLPSLLTCKWNLSSWHSELLDMITGIFSILGCVCYGVLADKYGRKTALSLALVFVFVFGAVSAGLPNYTWFLIFRTVAVFSFGGFAQVLTLCCEYMPGPQRGQSVFILSCFYAAGVVIMQGVFYTAVQPAYWRLFVFVATIPSGIAMIMMAFCPESIRFLLLNEEYFPANAIAEEMAEANRRQLPFGTLYAHPSARKCRKKRGRLSRMLDKEHRKSTLLFWFMGLATSITYYSLDATTDYFVQGLTEVMLRNVKSSKFRPLDCLYDWTEHWFIEVMWTNTLDFPGFVMYLIVVDGIDRKKLLCASCTISSLFIFLLLIPTTSLIMPTSFLFYARTVLVGQFVMLLLMVAEVYPTTERGTAVGLQAAIFCLGSFVTPYIVQGLLEIKFGCLIGFIGIIVFLSGIATSLLTWETRQMELRETARTN